MSTVIIIIIIIIIIMIIIIACVPGPFEVVWVQILATSALVLYGISLLLDAVSRTTLFMLVALNRITEFCMALAGGPWLPVAVPWPLRVYLCVCVW